MKSIYIKNILTFTIAAIPFLFTSCKKDVLEPELAQRIAVPTQEDLNRILFVNDTLGFIAGGSKYYTSDLLTTTDGGKTWSLYRFTDEISKAVYGLAFNGSDIYGVGYDGKIYVKNPANADWQRVQAPIWEWFQSIAFSEPDKGFIVVGDNYQSGRIYRTDDLGNTALVDSFPYQLNDIAFPTAQTGYACGYGAVLKTTDGGDHWELLNVKGDFFRSISCVDANNAWIAGYNGSIFHTSDGGQSWERQRNGDNPLQKKYRLRFIVFKDLYTGYAVGDKGLIIKTTDAGKHWVEFEHVVDEDLRCITVHPDGSLWAVGAGGTVLHIKE